MMADNETWDDKTLFERIIQHLDLPPETTRRGFIRLTVGTAVVLPVYSAFAAPAAPLIINEDAEGLIVADSTRCVGCKRCELVCTEFNDGKSAAVAGAGEGVAQLQLRPARGSSWASAATSAGEFGNFRIDAGHVQAVPASGAVRDGVSEFGDCAGREDRGAGGGCEAVHGLPVLPARVSVGDDDVRRGDEQGEQVLPVQRRPGVRGQLLHRRDQVCRVARPVAGGAGAQAIMPAVFGRDPRTAGCAACHQIK